MTDRLLTAPEVAELLNVPESWVRQETRAGRIPAIALGRYWRYDRTDVLTWVASLKTAGAPAAWRRYRPTCATGAGEG